LRSARRNNDRLGGAVVIGSDIRATAPAAVQGLLKGGVVFTNFEAAVAEKGETVHEGRGFIAPPEALDALTTFGFNLLSLSDNHAFDLKVTGIQNTLRASIPCMQDFVPANCLSCRKRE
jgi:poly-gamma-glutamate capsule biosynthesis protein CapA/YwtB (metallophosphatase superfamily)